jgi:prolyl-tRNA synthetase
MPSKLIVDPDAKLEEELVVRPTSEAIIWNTYKNWIQSYRDLPILDESMGQCGALGNAYAFVFAYSRIFMARRAYCSCHKRRSSEETKLINGLYADFAENFMAIPVIQGLKSESERFAGAEETYCIEALMQDGKALQAGTSHFLGQNFAKAFDVKFATQSGGLEYVWASSWGVSTRLMGALIMTHSDDNGWCYHPIWHPYSW